jgi:hypothetical protein
METALATETLAFLQCGSEIAGVCPHSLRETAPAAFLIKHTTAQLRLFSGSRLDCGQSSWFLIRSHDRSLPLSNRSNSRGRLYIALGRSFRPLDDTTPRYSPISTPSPTACRSAPQRASSGSRGACSNVSWPSGPPPSAASRPITGSAPG